jgi:hypothetical protein
MKTDRDLLKSYRDRWKAVEEVIAAERAALTPDERLRQIAALYEFARWASRGRRRTDDSEVRNRWAKLKEQAGETRSP